MSNQKLVIEKKNQSHFREFHVSVSGDKSAFS